MPEYSNYVEGRTNADALDGSELVAISQDGAARKTTTQDIADLGGGGGTWGAITGTLSAQTDLQSALDAKATTGSVSTVANDLSNHISDTSDAHDASAISFAATGNIASTDVQAAIVEMDSEKSNALITYRTETASHTLDATDLASINAGATLVIQMNVGSGNNLTVPLNSTQAFPTGAAIFVDQIGVGPTTIVATGGVTLTSADGLVIAAQYAGCVLKKRGTDTWTVQGKLVL